MTYKGQVIVVEIGIGSAVFGGGEIFVILIGLGLAIACLSIEFLREEGGFVVAILLLVLAGLIGSRMAKNHGLTLQAERQVADSGLTVVPDSLSIEESDVTVRVGDQCQFKLGLHQGAGGRYHAGILFITERTEEIIFLDEQRLERLVAPNIEC